MRNRMKRRREDGAALVEFALVFPLLVMFLLGIFTGGVVYNRKLAIANGVREGSRYGATLPVASAASTCATKMDCWLAQVATLTQQASEGNLAATVAGLNLCVAYVFPNGDPAAAPNDSTRRLVRTSAGDTISTGSTCFADGRPNTERRIQVTGSRTGKVEFLVGKSDVVLSSESVTRFEAAV